MIKKILLSILLSCILLILLTAMLWYLANRNSPVQSNKDYVGSVTCRECHNEEYASWSKTAHARAIQEVSKDYNPIIGKWDRTLVFKEGDLPEVTIKLDRSVDAMPLVTLKNAADPGRESTFKVFRVSGGHGWKQRLYTKIDGDYYALPLDWNQSINDWVPFRLSFWWKSNGELRRRPFKMISWGSMCAGCHETGVVTTLGFTGYQKSESIETAIACEKCHGPGAAHLDDPEAANIINPSKLPFDRQVEVCGQCHGYGKSVPTGILSRYPMKEFGGETYRPGKELAKYFKPDPILWEGTIYGKKHRQQYFDLLQSAHYSNQVGCIDCHAPHGSKFKNNLKTTVNDDRLCLKCHGENPRFRDTAAIDKHTGHSSFPEAKDKLTCLSCHQQRSTFSAIMGDGTSHHFKIVSPALSLEMFDRFKDAEPLPDYCSDKRIGHASLLFCYSQKVIPNSCNGCHDEWKGTREGFEAGVKAFNEMFH